MRSPLGRNGVAVSVDSIIIPEHLDKNGNEISQLDEGIELQPNEYLLYPAQQLVLIPGQRVRVKLTMKIHRLRKGRLDTI